MSEVSKKGIIEALIFASPNAIPRSKMASIANLDSAADVDAFIEALNVEYERNGRSFRIKSIAGGYQFFTSMAYAPYLREVLAGKGATRLSRAMLEVLSIVALKQPITKPIIDRTRAADSGGPLHSLLEQGLITIRGRRKGPGRPFLYGTTRKFLSFFGLEGLKDLPDEAEISSLFSEERGNEAGG